VARSYWLDLFTGTTWEEFLAAGGEISGFRERRWKTVQQMKPDDYLLCYLTGISRWIGVLEVTADGGASLTIPGLDPTPAEPPRSPDMSCKDRGRPSVVAGWP
jgi:hypothetical protein